MAKADAAVVPHVHENHVAVFVSELPMSMPASQSWSNPVLDMLPIFESTKEGECVCSEGGVSLDVNGEHAGVVGRLHVLGKAAGNFQTRLSSHLNLTSHGLRITLGSRHQH